MVFIYTISDPRTGIVRYVGKTTAPKRRWRDHLKDSRKSHKVSWIKSLVSDGVVPSFEVIEECTDDSWKERERFWISTYRETLTNHSPGGDGGGSKHSPETRRKMSETRKGRPAHNKGIPRTEETKHLLSEITRRHGKFNFVLGMKHSEDTRNKMSCSRKGVKRGPYKKRK